MLMSRCRASDGCQRVDVERPWFKSCWRGAGAGAGYLRYSVCSWSKKSSTINDEAESADFSSPASVRRTKGLAGI
jgi:hypothetical protein